MEIVSGSLENELVGRVENLPNAGINADWNVRRRHVVPTDLPFSQLQCTEAWNSLTNSQRHFVHHFARALWSGSRICAKQLSKESPGILRILLLLFSSTDLEDLKRRSKEGGVMQKEWEYFLAYATCFLTNLGNYLSFGDLKIVPGISEQKLNAIVNLCPLKGQRKERLLSLWKEARSAIYSLAPGERTLGFPPGGVSAYYSDDMTSEEVKLVSEWMKEANIEPWNTRIWKRESPGMDSSLPEYDLRIASALETPTETHVFQSKCVINVIHGDFKEDLGEVVKHLKDALPYADNDTQRNMVNCFVLYMETGSVEHHKRSQEIWLDQKDLFIHFNLGFIETYRDPSGLRAEFEGFVGTVNKAATKQFATLIEKVDLLLSYLPWPKEYEADEFICPAFECIEVFLYANGTIPAGINLPNYESVRQVNYKLIKRCLGANVLRKTHGSRNFCLANVLESHDNGRKTTFLKDDDEEICKRCKADVFLIQLAFHELLGHGSGKLFTQGSEGNYNFSRGTVIHPFTDEAVMTCYGPGDTWNSIFGQISSAFEECRAECVGLYLSAYPQALEVFNYVGQHAEDVTYMNWLLMARAGLLALEYFCLETGDWKQAHMQARFGILRTLLDASEKDAQSDGVSEKDVQSDAEKVIEQDSKFLEIVRRGDTDDIVLHMNRDKIMTVGLPAIRDLLVKLQVCKSTADVEGGRKLFIDMTSVPKTLLTFQRSMLAKKTFRPIFVQISTKLHEVDGISRIEMQEFQPTAEGLIESYVAHFEDWIANC